MPLGTLDRTPPPFFKQGASALTRLIFFSAFALFLMAADTRFKLTQPVRAAIATALAPVERAVMLPVRTGMTLRDYLAGIGGALARADGAERRLAEQAERANRVEPLERENARLRGLLELQPRFSARTHAAEVLYESSDLYTRKLVIDRGSSQGIVAASPVIDASGVLGQVTRVYPLSAEVSLLIDKDAAIPVRNLRTDARAVAYGDPSAEGGGMELRFIAANADIEPGDRLQTSGVDGVYPAGLEVATVASVDRRGGSQFAKVVLAPAARFDGLRHVLVVEPLALQLPARPAPEPELPAAPAKARRP
ncbi:MAG TPA: rod shape-determining protein MreC [Methylibium sp.]|uniref:rod shape-determining protein MreC n=1 Tax=Methylibium sp. TaxID=2067992 RepID=UPI002DB5D36E|nr:rod shape-determining protein MreC [Methylibium sp.]HEU4458864.1 rod shape-determining protein MreC [Methylibium sp.]